MELDQQQHLEILLIKAGLKNRDALAELMNTWRQTVTANIHGRRKNQWFREKLFEILHRRLPEEVKEYSDVWIDESVDEAEKAAA